MSDEDDIVAELRRLREGLPERLRGDLKLSPDSPLARPVGSVPRYLFGNIEGRHPSFRRLGGRSR